MPVVPKGLDHEAAVQAFMVLLSVAEQDRENQPRYDTSGYDVLRDQLFDP